MHRPTLYCLVLMVVLAGCAAEPFAERPDDKSAPVHLGNSANDTYRFEVSVAVIGPNVTVRRSNGDTRTFDLTASSFGSESTKGNPITEVELPDTARLYGKYTLGPGEKKEFTIEEVRQDEALLVVIFDVEDGAIHSFHGAHCRPVYFAGFNVTIRNGSDHDAYWSSSCGPG